MQSGIKIVFESHPWIVLVSLGGRLDSEKMNPGEVAY